MEDKKHSFLLTLLKLSFTAVISLYPFLISQHQNSFSRNALMIFLILIVISSNLLYDLFNKPKILFLLISLITTVYLYFVFDKIFILIIPFIILDLLAFLELSPLYGIFTLILFIYSGTYKLTFVLTVLFVSSIYFLITQIIQQSAFIEKTFKTEKELKSKLVDISKKHKHELIQTALKYENQRLHEKSTLSQNLHDKIGHAINGSIFKLEGAKLLVSKDTQKSSKMLEEVIDLLRASTDEIRILLRNEKPSKETININKLNSIFVNFQDKYNIETSFKYGGDVNRVPAEVWNVFLENTVEGLTNSLKYSECNRIHANLIVYNKIIRYTIRDNGKGTTKIVDGMGLTGMKERMHSIHGSVSVLSSFGFEINMLVPLGSEEDE